MKNNIPRSYFEIPRNKTELLNNNQVLKADAIIIDLEDLRDIYFDKSESLTRINFIKDSKIKIYVKLDTKNLKKSFKDLELIDPEIITGFSLPHASKSLLNKMSVRARDFEQTSKLNFGTINFIAYIDSPEAVVNYRKIASYGRVVAVYIDNENYLEYLGLKKSERNYLREQVFVSAVLSKKPVIDSYVSDNEELLRDLHIGKELGTTSKLTKDINQINKINEYYTPTKEEIEEANLIYNILLNTKKKYRRKFNFEDLEISQYKVIKSQIILSRSDELKEALDIIVTNESVKDGSKVLKPNKFYTFGEEIGNAITHGIGALMTIVFLILLLFKGQGEGTLVNFSYIVYALSAFTLYFSSTMYHALPLGSRSKRLFHKFDRMSIYLLIAGTYTPLTLTVVGGKLGMILFIILWGSSLIGILLNFLKFGKFKFVHMFLYVFLGWIAIFYIKTIFAALGRVPSILILLGGIAYTVGIIFYSMKLFKFTHMVWHFFTILGTVLHFIAIYLA